jgi:cell division protein ZapA (FtsZ GTPase activity inhibitor)
MEIIAFLLGVGSVIAIAVVVSMFRMNKRIANSEQKLNDQEKQFDSVYREFENTNNTLHQHVDELYSVLDSRFDKFENKLNNKK